jgi:hypothetical protein
MPNQEQCPQCGMTHEFWAANSGRGYRKGDATYCCSGCAEGTGCTCIQSEIKVREAKLEENKQHYVEKMERQIKEWETRLQELQGIARQRNAEQNSVVKEELETLRRKLDETRTELQNLKTGQAWPEQSRKVSGSYKEAKDAASHTSSIIKRK